MSMGARAMIHANQQQQRIERHGSKRVGGHAMDFAFQIQSDDGHSCSEASHRLAKFGRAEAHCISDDFAAATAYISTALACWGQCIMKERPASEGRKRMEGCVRWERNTGEHRKIRSEERRVGKECRSPGS